MFILLILDHLSRLRYANILYGSRATKPDSDRKRRLYILGWYLGNSLYDFNNEVKRFITLTAKWVLAGYTVTFLNATGGILKL